MSLNQKSKKKNHQLSFTKKCILLANIQNETDKILLNTFNFIPLVKLYTGGQKQETFNYTTIKGGLFLLQDKNFLEKNFYLRIYDSKNYSLRFNLEINQDTRKNYIKVEPNFYCFNLKIGCIGFLFASAEEAEQFKKLFDAGEPDQDTKDNTEKFNLFPLKDTDDLFLDLIDSLVDELKKKFGIITLGEQLVEDYHEIAEYLIFSGFLEASQLLGNMEFDKEDNLFNLFIDKKYPNKLFKKMFYNYDMNKLYPVRPICIDYINIYNKSNYVDLLVGHLINNNKESIQILKKRKENNLKEKNNKIRESNKNSRQLSTYELSKRKTTSNGGIGMIEEDPDEDDDAVRTTSNAFGKFFSGLNPFK
jgi:hypothetical protein